jgi:serine/threonine protein kinase
LFTVPLGFSEALLAIPPHPNIIPLYDSFILVETKSSASCLSQWRGIYINLSKSRNGRRPFTGGLIALIFRQIVQGLHHIHASGYSHRNMKPENNHHLSYRNLSPLAPPDAPPEEDIEVSVKLADFGLRISVDMWALGTIMACQPQASFPREEGS